MYQCDYDHNDKFFKATRHHLTVADSPGALFDVDATEKMLKL